TSQKSEPVLRGTSILEFDISSDGKDLLFSTQPSGRPSQLWLAALDKSSPPRMIASNGEDSPYFGPDGQILYRLSDGNNHYLAQPKAGGSELRRMVPSPVGTLQFISPDRRWISAVTEPPGGGVGGTYAVPIDGGAPRRICACPAIWAPDGKFL